ncbi:extensin family protein [Novosphingobium sp. Chol11]|uniref:extensin family protein n=1 Tax=Novosphingobium sp. Chol11 TaxID=1385763 RepID=UPI0025E65150|nr:extensin family protein [Novosphingobium sp. Chol11]
MTRRPAASAILPAMLLAAVAGCVDAPKQRSAPSRWTSNTSFSGPDARACLSDLGRQQANFTPLQDQYFGAGCSALNAVRLAALRSDDSRLALTNLGPVTCPLAHAISGWARFGVDRAARQILGSPLARIETMGSYSCRKVAGTNRLSGHASANAVDIAGFVLADGRRITVLRDWDNPSPQVRAFLSSVRTSACKRFGTVLTPNYNAAHRDHFHLEVADARPLCR